MPTQTVGGQTAQNSVTQLTHRSTKMTRMSSLRKSQPTGMTTRPVTGMTTRPASPSKLSARPATTMLTPEY